MNADMTILYNYIREKNAAGETVTYSAIVKDGVLKRSNPTVFKTLEDMIEEGHLRVEFLRSDSGHFKRALFVSMGDEAHREHLLMKLISESVRMRMSLESFMSGEIERGKKTAVWHRLDDFEDTDDGQ